jgi:hypothetical protein
VDLVEGGPPDVARPRRDIVVSFWLVFSCPNTGSTVRARILLSVIT